MRKYLVCLCFSGILLPCFTRAQHLTLGVRGGISIPNLSASGSDQNPLNTGYSSRLGPDAGIFVNFKFSDLFSLQPMVEYSSQGGKKDGFQAFPPPAAAAAFFPPGEVPTYLYADFKSTAKFTYLMIPVLAKFSKHFHESPWSVYVDAGPFVGFLLSAKQSTSGQGMIYTDPEGQQPLPIGTQSFVTNNDIKDQLHDVNVGVDGNLGVGYHFSRNAIFIEGGGNYGFLNIQKGTANGKNKTGAATASLGYSYTFGK